MASPRNLIRIAFLVALMLGVLWTLAAPKRPTSWPAATQKRSCQTGKDAPASCRVQPPPSSAGLRV